MKHSEHLSGFLEFLRNCETEYNIAVMQQEESNNATQDLLHRLEINATAIPLALDGGLR